MWKVKLPVAGGRAHRGHAVGEPVDPHLVLADPAAGDAGLPATLETLHLNFQGALLIALLIVVGLTARLGLQEVLERITGWTWAALALVGVALLASAKEEQRP